MFKLTLIFAAVATFAAGAAQAHYLPVANGKTELARNYTEINVDGKSYSQTFALDGKAYTDITFSLFAKGDYGIGSNETISLYLDNILFGTWSYGNAPFSQQNSYDYDYYVSGAVSVSATQWATISADKFMTVSWTNSASVNAYNANTTQEAGQDYVSWSVQGTPKAIVTPPVTAVPEPTSIALLGLGLAGLAALRRRKA